MKILFHYPHNSSDPKILKVFLKSFLTKMKPTKYPVKEKKKEAINEKKRGGEILLSHARTSHTDILHLDQKAAKCMTCQWLYGKV